MKHCETCTCPTADPSGIPTRRELMERAMHGVTPIQAIVTYRRTHQEAFGFVPSLRESKDLYEQVRHP